MKILSNYHNLQVLFEDNHLIIINKRPGDIVQGDKTKDTPLIEIVKKYLKIKYKFKIWHIAKYSEIMICII